MSIVQIPRPPAAPADRWSLRGERLSSKPAPKNIQDLTDAALVSRLRLGDMNAARVLFKRYEPHLKAVLYYMHGEKDEIPDIIQETFMKFFLKPWAYDETRPFKAWITTIARRQAIDFHRKSSRRQAQELSGQGSDGPDDPGLKFLGESNYLSSGQEAGMNESRLFQVRAAQHILSLMKERDRELLHLTAIGRTSTEISELFGEHVPTIKSQLHRARGRFHDLYLKIFGPDREIA